MPKLNLDTSAIRNRFEEAGQAHVFRFWKELNESERSQLASECSMVDLAWVKARAAQYQAEKGGVKKAPKLEPAPIISLPKTADEQKRQAAAREVGEDALRAGRLAAFLVAGGQGTRLGFDGPKGCYPIGPVTQRTLFQWHAEQIRSRAKRYGKTIPWYIMTSTANNAATQAFFAQNDYFGFSPCDVMFFVQGMVPAMDFDGRLLLETNHSLALNPDGHGGSLSALVKSGAIADMKKRGVDTISYFQVDNPIVTVCDPVFAGYHIQAKAEMSSKILDKNCPEEKVGAICKIDGKLGVIEYSDLDKENMYAKGADGKLRFWAGSIAIHMLSVDFVERVGGKAELPFHIAIKKIPCVGADGKQFKPEKANGVKFEQFVFDALPLTTSSVTMEVVREDEFAPVKNPDGIDSVVSCRGLLTSRANRWLTAAGVTPPPAGTLLEMAYTYAIDEIDVKQKSKAGSAVAANAVLE